MLTYAALKFTCEPQNVYVIRANRHMYYGKKFFVGKVMCNARWDCKQTCCCDAADGTNNNERLDAATVANEDFRTAEVLLMGNSRKAIINLVKQYHPNFTVMTSMASVILSPEKISKGQENKRKGDELEQFKSPREYKKMRSQVYEEKSSQSKLNEIILSTSENTIVPLDHQVPSNEILSSKVQYISFQDYNDNAITGPRLAVSAE